jgi:heat shock protein HslJ
VDPGAPRTGHEITVEPAAAPVTSLASGRWTLAELDGEAVTAAEGQSMPYLELDAETSHVSGSGGCNSLTGSFEKRGDELRFGPIATTLMACPDPVMQRETAFLAALAATTRYELDGESLALLADDTVVARLVASTPTF